MLVLGTVACSSSGDEDPAEFRPADTQVSTDPAPAATAAQDPPSDPVVLANRLTAAEQTVRDSASSPEELRSAARSAQVGYRVLEGRPDWDGAVLGAVPPALVDVVRRNTAARRDLAAMHTRLPDTVPAWRIVEPPPVAELRGYYEEAEARFGVPWEILAAVNLVETGSGRIVGLSSAGAQGPMQFLPGTWARYGLGGDVWDPHDAILGAANYLAANGGAGDLTNPGLENALYRYNNDSRYGRAVREYAAVMHADPRAFDGFHAWDVYYRTAHGDLPLPVGYEEPVPVPVPEWLSRQPR